jgi:zinc transport system substrate-binding protein
MIATFRRLVLSLALLLPFNLPALAMDPPKVLASIKPLHSLALNVMEGVGAKPTLLLRATASAHTYTLRPSDARAIEQADVVFWIGPDYESFMAKAVSGLQRRARVVTMSRADGVTLLPTREGGVWAEDDDHDHAQSADTEHDMHLWLDPVNAKALARAMAATLAEADPAHAARYQANAQALAARLDTLDSSLRTRLTPVAHKPFIVFHDGYQYFEKRYGLTAAGSITVTPDRTPGPRRLSDLRRAIAERNASCVFGEPQFTSALVGTVAKGTVARTGVLDALGAAIPEGKDVYFVMMEALADSFVGCLNGAS